jgi:hypothetical protein
MLGRSVDGTGATLWYERSVKASFGALHTPSTISVVANW